MPLSVSADIAGSNGIIHLIDAVLLPDMDATPTLETRMSDDFGTVLTDQAGRTLYFFAPDINGENNCSGGCANNWPIFFAEEINLDGMGDEALIGSIETENGMQTTYNGWPLYYFAGDEMMPNTFNGDGVGDNWFVAKPDYTLMVAVGQLVGADGNNYVEEDGMIVAGDGNSRFFVDFASGRTLYRFINDEPNTSNFGGNPEIWPLFTNEVVWAPSTVSTEDFMEITAGQISFRGNPLYKFGQDQMRGDTRGVSVPNPGVWPTVNEGTPVLE
ncbi:hypothetical protein [Nitritalea halalkaliphila]|nr:hypothetical protein [Nitritalea halalkaliphila]